MKGIRRCDVYFLPKEERRGEYDRQHPIRVGYTVGGSMGLSYAEAILLIGKLELAVTQIDKEEGRC